MANQTTEEDQARQRTRLVFFNFQELLGWR